ncbi:hypothetical protein Pcinc_037013 [Petrolisthes cinctipes]|uniref:Lipocalin/cytosolic fatty-acid binding domain-containing protein n=1 Tax=Petrolisthes cinctipes TaxID=88211 RepID=A0AAE1BTE5_PETCI|nr:hypothetical protein Pcinc_037013 [Petrolisthes cinctipes]
MSIIQSQTLTNMKSLTLILAFVAITVADKIPDFIVPGQCPPVDTEGLWRQQQPNHSKYAGVWYQHAITNNPYQPNVKCNRIQYDFDGHGFDAKTNGITAEGNLLRHNGKIYPNPLGVPVLSIDYEGMFASPYTVLDTDYENYSCIYSCIDYNHNYYSDFAFIFTRSPSLSDQHLRKCQKAFSDINVDISRFSRTEQGSSCPYDALKNL